MGYNHKLSFSISIANSTSIPVLRLKLILRPAFAGRAVKFWVTATTRG